MVSSPSSDLDPFFTDKETEEENKGEKLVQD